MSRVPERLDVTFTRTSEDVAAAHALLLRRIGPALVEDRASFAVSATVETADWIPLLGVVRAGSARQPAAAQLGGLLPRVAPGLTLLSLPYTAVDVPYEGRGVYRTLKMAMLRRLAALATARGLPPPAGNVSEESPGSAQYRRKVERAHAIVLPVPYRQPALHGLAEVPLALTYEPLDGGGMVFDRALALAVVRAVYRALYRIDDPEANPAYRRIAEEAGSGTATAVPAQPGGTADGAR